MREALKNLFSNTIVVENGDKYNYSVKPFDLTNSLGNGIALLQQYSFSIAGSTNDSTEYKLYKTKEGNWYDLDPAGAYADSAVVRMLKSAIDKKEAEELAE